MIRLNGIMFRARTEHMIELVLLSVIFHSVFNKTHHYIKQFPGPFPNMYRMSHAPDIFRPSHTSPAHKKTKLMVIAYIATHLQLGRLCWSTLACQSMVATSWSGRRASRMWGTTPDPCAADVWSHSSRACTCAHGSGRSTHSKSEVLRSVLDWIWTTHGMLT